MTSADSDDASSLFEVATQDNEETADTRARVQRLKRTLFDLSYLVMNADGTEHISEQMLVRKLENRLTGEGSVDVEARADALARVLDGGEEAVRSRVDALAEELVELAGDRADALGTRYLDFLKGLIVADASVAPLEYDLFEALCEHWDVDMQLPRS